MIRQFVEIFTKRWAVLEALTRFGEIEFDEESQNKISFKFRISLHHITNGKNQNRSEKSLARA